MDQYNFKKGDKVRIIGNCADKDGNEPHHMFDIGDVGTIIHTHENGILVIVVDGMAQFVNPQHVELVPKVFPLSEIEAGYLLKVEDTKNQETLNMTVIPSDYYDTNNLGCCCPGKWYWPVSAFSEDSLQFEEYSILAVYGRTNCRDLLANLTENRELLWERKKPKKMTLAEICEALGYEVEIVEE